MSNKQHKWLVRHLMNNSEPNSFVVLGAGTWGITLADILARNGHRVNCWDIDAALIDWMNRERRHPKLEGFTLDEGVLLTSDLDRALEGARACVIVVPSQVLRKACQAVAAKAAGAGIEAWVICTKGIEQGSLLPMHDVLRDALGEGAGARIGILSGPSHAEEVSRGLPTTVVACSKDEILAREIQHWFHRPYFRVYTHDDMLGVELGGSIKNVIAIAAGISDGLGFGDNTRAALMTRGLAEIVRLGLAAGAKLETFMGLSGIGDLIVTAGSRHSRNHTFGNYLAQGLSAGEALERVGMVVEGYATARSAHELAQRHGVEMPITEAVYRVLYEELSVRQMVEGLLARDPKPEHY
jgi:glycerol-3-phosphate dehydrogenase (NAD(P)+)